jgi:hypothetical protein
LEEEGEGVTPRRLRGDGRRLAGALTFLRRGLRDGDDPLYDPWKLSAGAHERTPSQPQAAGAPQRRLALPRWSAIVFTSALLFAASVALLTLLGHAVP